MKNRRKTGYNLCLSERQAKKDLRKARHNIAGFSWLKISITAMPLKANSGIKTACGLGEAETAL